MTNSQLISFDELNFDKKQEVTDQFPDGILALLLVVHCN